GAVAASTWWLWLLALGAAIVGVRTWSATPAGRARIDCWLLTLPGIGRLVGAAALARVAHTLSTVLAGGVRLEGGLDLPGAGAGNARVATALAGAREAVRQGQQLAPALRASAVMPPSLVRLGATGGRRGEQRGGPRPPAAR